MRLMVAVSVFSLLAACTQGSMRKRVGTAPAFVATTDDADIARGRYLGTHVTGCASCHSERNWESWAGPVMDGTVGKGGQQWDRDDGFPGILTATNISPTGIGTWTDGELLHAITTGLHRDGHALFPIMPYRAYRFLTEADAKAIVSWLRTLEPVESEEHRRVLAFPMNRIVNKIPAPAQYSTPSAEPTRLERGRYLVQIAGCKECHTPVKRGRTDDTRAFSGGREFPLSNGVAISTNITPDEGNGIGYWGEDAFLSRFQAYREDGSVDREASPTDPNTPMPWHDYAGMTDDDLKAIWTLLQTIEANPNKIEASWRGR